MKRFITYFLLLAMLMSALTIPVLADSNHSDTTFDFDIYFNSFNNRVTMRAKLNSSPVYMWIQQIYDNTAFTCVRIEGFKFDRYGNVVEESTSLTLSNGSLVPYVSCNVNTKYLIHTLYFEEDFHSVRPAFRSGGPTVTHISGKWSPDSIGDYEDAVYYQ